MKRISIILLLIGFTLFFCACQAGDDSASEEGPVTGNSGTLSTTSTSGNSLVLNWTAAQSEHSSSRLEYIVYYSTSDNLKSIFDCEENGTAAGDYEENITSKIISGLSPSTTYHFNVIVRDENDNKSLYSAQTQTTSSTTDTNAPEPDNSGTITASSISNTTLTLNWTLASDDTSATADLQYLAYYSNDDNLDSVTDTETNGTAIGSYASNIATKAVTGLSEATTYYFNVIVKDVEGNKALYRTLTQTTSSTSDSSAPTPGNSGTITASSVADTTLTLNWTAASDDTSAVADLQYRAYYSTSNDLDSVTNTEINGTAIGSYASNITTKAVTGLSASTTYYFNVIVKDGAGNKALYSTLTQATTATPDTTAPTPGNSGTITAASVADTTLTLNWTAATDNTSAVADLQYRAYYSSSNNLSSVSNTETNGTAIGSYASNITTKAVTGLSESTTYYFNVIVKDGAGNKALHSTLTQATTATPDTTAPTPGNSGTITAASVADTTLTLNWTVASDDTSAVADLQYRAYYSTSNNLSSVSNTETNGTPIGSYASNITTKAVTGLSASTTYYFNVIVKDGAGNKALYSTLTQTTTATPDTTAPTPGNSGTITAASVTDTTLTLNWTAASDNTSAVADLQYRAYYSTSNNLSSVSNTETNGTAIGSYASNITTKAVTGLSASTTYYFNVIVKDEAGNKALFSTLTQATTATPAAIPSDYIIRWSLNNNGNDEKGGYNASNTVGSPVYTSSSPKEGSHYLTTDGDDGLKTGNYNFTSNLLSISAWVYLDSSATGNVSALNLDRDMGIWYDGTKLKVSLNGSIYAYSTISLDTWVHVVMTWDNSTIKMYLNGNTTPVDSYSGSLTLTTAYSGSYPWNIGMRADNSEYWMGKIDDIIIYDRTLTSSEVADIYSSY